MKLVEEMMKGTQNHFCYELTTTDDTETHFEVSYQGSRVKLEITCPFVDRHSVVGITTHLTPEEASALAFKLMCYSESARKKRDEKHLSPFPECAEKGQEE